METMSPDLMAEWAKLYSALQADHSFSQKLAGMFWGHVPDGYSEQPQRVLYVGKATGGPFDIENASAEYFGCNGAAFWSLARKLGQSANPRCPELANIAWSNLCKIGTVSGNPDNRLAEAQHDLAVKTLRDEVKRVKPTVVVCVAEGYQDHFVYEALGVEQGKDDGFFEIHCEGVALYYRHARDGWPGILWMKHPQFRRTAYLEIADLIARGLMYSCSAATLQEA